MQEKTIGAFISALRKSKGYTQKELGELLGVSDKAISRWERDECLPDISLIPVLADIFGVTADELLRGQKSPSKATPLFSEKSEKLKKHMINTAFTKFKTKSIISILIAAVGIILAAVINYGFIRAYIAFGAALLFFVVAAVCEIIFALNAISSVNIDDDSIKELADKRKKDIYKTSYIIIVLIFSAAIASVPLLFAGDAYNGLLFATWSVYGLVRFAAGIGLSAIIGVFIKPLIFNKISAEISETEIRNNHITKKALCITLCIMLLTAGVHVFILTQDAEFFSDGTVFDNPKDFKAVMEKEEFNNVFGDGSVAIAYETQPLGEEPIESEEEYTETIEDENGNVICSYVQRNQNVIRYEILNDKNGEVKIRAFTYDDYNDISRAKTIINICFAALYAAEVVTAALICRKKRRS